MVHNMPRGRTTQGSESDDPPPYSEGRSLRTSTTGILNHVNGRSPLTIGSYGAVHHTSHPETVPLIQKKERRPWYLWLTILLAVTITFAICSITMPITWCNDPLDPAVRDRIRKEWDAETRHHGAVAEHHRVLELKWKTEEEAHKELSRRWAKERIDHDREIKERDRREEEAHKELSRKWEKERIDHNREIEERDRREEEERQKLNMFWVDVKAHGCPTYATRTYSARLANIPRNYQRRVQACRASPLIIHGTSHTPLTCEDDGPTAVIGHWSINQNEPGCTSFWDSYKDKGCASEKSGKRRIEHKLQNLPSGSDWNEFAATTPVTFHGLHFPGAHEAFQTIWGVFGLWEIDDPQC